MQIFGKFPKVFIKINLTFLDVCKKFHRRVKLKINRILGASGDCPKLREKFEKEGFSRATSGLRGVCRHTIPLPGEMGDPAPGTSVVSLVPWQVVLRYSIQLEPLIRRAASSRCSWQSLCMPPFHNPSSTGLLAQ